MFRDAKEELQRLEQELLEEEAQPDREEPEEAFAAYTKGCRAYNSDRTDVDLEEFSRQVREPEQSLTGWIVLAFLLMTGIICVLGYWVLRFLGVVG